MYGDGCNYTYCGYHFAKYTIIESLYLYLKLMQCYMSVVCQFKKRQQIPKDYQLLVFCPLYFTCIIYIKYI